MFFAALHAVAAPKQVRLAPKAVHGGALEPYQPPARTDDWEPLSIGTGGPPETPAYQACQDQGTSSGAPSLGWIWSFPGSGNTVTRLLLDAASGHMTGSVYNDTSLVGGLAGEALDAQSAHAAGELTLIKTHTFQGEHASKGTACIGCGQRPQGILPSPQEWPMVKRAAALTREPYAAILAEYARQTTGCVPRARNRTSVHTWHGLCDVPCALSLPPPSPPCLPQLSHVRSGAHR